MPAFLAETYGPAGAPGTVRAGLAAGQVSQPGAPVRFLVAVAVPEEETCFWLYQAPSAGAVRAAMTRAGLRPERITPAVAVWPPRPRPAPGPHGPTGAPTRPASHVPARAVHGAAVTVPPPLPHARGQGSPR